MQYVDLGPNIVCVGGGGGGGGGAERIIIWLLEFALCYAHQ